ncbi:HNH endonuclease [Massilia sp. GER05]|uniref:HNH endonuclease n=1 Tax=Massilia sp. GER05 TaxID=3394605 RepID=UPI003F85B2F3
MTFKPQTATAQYVLGKAADFVSYSGIQGLGFSELSALRSASSTAPLITNAMRAVEFVGSGSGFKNPRLQIGAVGNIDKLIADRVSAKPLNSPNPQKWIDNGGSVWNELDGTWVYSDKVGNVVRYPNGFPDFEGGGYVRQSVDIDMVPNHTTDFINANKTAPLGPKLPTNTWHHNENGVTMQEIDKIIHSRFTHRGGVSIMKGQQ